MLEKIIGAMLLLIVFQSKIAFADCSTGYACKIDDLLKMEKQTTVWHLENKNNFENFKFSDAFFKKNPLKQKKSLLYKK